MKTVLDASVLIDMTSFDLLEAWFALGYETITTSFVWREVNRRSQKVELQSFYKRKQPKVPHERKLCRCAKNCCFDPGFMVSDS
jgi:hypothetical protein